jgi:hypothetical protein
VRLRTGRSAVPGTLLRYRRAVRALLLLVTAVLAAGCTTAVPGTPSAAGPAPLPPRPREVRLDGVDPCSLLTATERAEAGLDGVPRYTNPPTPLFGGTVPTCTITGLQGRPVALGIGIVTTAGIERWQRNDLDAVVRDTSIAGFPSVVAIPKRATEYCSVEVDVAAGQLLDVQFSDGGGDPPIPQGELCSSAQRAATVMMQTLLAR